MSIVDEYLIENAKNRGKFFNIDCDFQFCDIDANESEKIR
jgi:hypothetical protein